VSAEGTVRQTYPQADYPKEELCPDQIWRDLLRQRGNTPIIHCATNNCLPAAVKRALVEGASDALVNEHFSWQYPIHGAALRNEPEGAVEIFEVLLRHGACPNVMRADGRHLLEVCRDRAKWIDDSEPSMGNVMFRIEHLMDGLEETERAESETLVELVTEAIKGHKMCKFCKGRKQAAGSNSVHLSMANMEDKLSQARRPPSSP
jgi:hypothetical protein